MKVTIGYDKEELTIKIKYIANLLGRMDTYITMMEEQGAGLRGNLDWASTGKTLRINAEQLKEALNGLEVRHIPYVNAIGFNYEAHLEEVAIKFKKEQEENELPI